MTDSPRAAVLFDVDGTLVDTSYLHTVAWWYACHDAGYGDVSMARIHRLIGMGGDVLIEELLGQFDEAVETAHKHRYAPHLEQLPVFDGAVDLLRASADLGLSVVLASSASAEEKEAHTKAMSEAQDVWAEFTSSADADSGKPDPDILTTALGKVDVAPEHAVMVGDAVWDVIAAGKIGLACVGVTSGGISAAELREAGAIAVYDGPRHLLEELDRSPLAAVARGERVAAGWQPPAD